MPKRLLIALLVAGLAPGAAAQMRGGFGFGGFRNGGFRNGAGFTGHDGRFGRGLVWFGDPLFYSDYSSQPPAYQPPASPVVIVQPAAVAAPAEPKPEPLMIEWQGDRYVRFSGQRESATRTSSSLDYSEAPSPAPTPLHKPTFQSSAATQASPVDLPPVVLVYRDGHREQVSDYVIANGNLYTRGDYWHDGFWNKTVQLSTLDLPSTLRANSDSGVKFVLPSGPNEVVTRP
jgi:hypothetical protein